MQCGVRRGGWAGLTLCCRSDRRCSRSAWRTANCSPRSGTPGNSTKPKPPAATRDLNPRCRCMVEHHEVNAAVLQVPRQTDEVLQGPAEPEPLSTNTWSQPASARAPPRTCTHSTASTLTPLTPLSDP